LTTAIIFGDLSFLCNFDEDYGYAAAMVHYQRTALIIEPRKTVLDWLIELTRNSSSRWPRAKNTCDSHGSLVITNHPTQTTKLNKLCDHLSQTR
jgi:hypothetical protein